MGELLNALQKGRTDRSTGVFSLPTSEELHSELYDTAGVDVPSGLATKDYLMDLPEDRLTTIQEKLLERFRSFGNRGNPRSPVRIQAAGSFILETFNSTPVEFQAIAANLQQSSEGATMAVHFLPGGEDGGTAHALFAMRLLLADMPKLAARLGESSEEFPIYGKTNADLFRLVKRFFPGESIKARKTDGGLIEFMIMSSILKNLGETISSDSVIERVTGRLPKEQEARIWAIENLTEKNVYISRAGLTD